MSRQVVVDHLYDERAGGAGGDLLPALQLLFGDCKSVATRTRVVVRFLLLEMIFYRVYHKIWKLLAGVSNCPKNIIFSC